MAGRSERIAVSLLYWSLRRVLELFVLRRRPEREKEIEILLLRHQLRVLERQVGRPRLAPFARRGYLGAAIEYRLSPEARFPAQIHDCKCAIRFLRRMSAEYHLDPKRIGVWGASAGGHLAALIGTTGEEAELEGNGGWSDCSSRVQAVVDWAGPADLGLLQSDQAASASCVPSYGDATSQPSILIGCALRTCTDAANAASTTKMPTGIAPAIQRKPARICPL